MFLLKKEKSLLLSKWTQKGRLSYFLLLVVFHTNSSPFFAESKLKIPNHLNSDDGLHKYFLMLFICQGLYSTGFCKYFSE